MSKIATPKRDVVFKRIFGVKGREEILKNFLSSILDMPIKNVTLDLDKEILPDFLDGKTSRVDVRAELDENTQVNIEIQVDTSDYSEDRCLAYWSKLYANSLKIRKRLHHFKEDHLSMDNRWECVSRV